jgi:arylsulfatase A-like enzyme
MLVTCHDLGRHLGCYGVGTVRTPALDGLSAQGVRFEQAYCVSPGCSPSRATLATGRYPHSNDVMGLTHGSFGWDLNPSERHAAVLFGEAGYETHLFGLQHVSPRAEQLGFGHVHGRGPGRRVAAQVETFLRGTLPEGPLYVEINLEEPHRPYSQGGVQPDDSGGVWVPPYLPDVPAAREEMAAAQGAIREADAAVGRILGALDASGLAASSLVVFTPDHGLAMPRAKCTLYDPGIGISLLARWPEGGVAGGRVVTELVSNVDVLPTLLDAAGLPLPANLQGRSFLPLLRGEAYAARDAVFAEKTYHSYYDPMRAVRTRTHKYIRNFETAFAVEVPGDIAQGSVFRSDPARYQGSTHPDVELYDLGADPHEQRNLAADPTYAEVRRELDARLWGWMEETDDPLLRGPIPSPAYARTMAKWERQA